MITQPSVAVIGAGMGGLTVAASCARSEWTSRYTNKRPDSGESGPASK